MRIPLEALSSEAVRGLIDEYCIRETGCNETEEPLENCRHGVAKALQQGRLVIVYTASDPDQVASLVPAEQIYD